MQIELHDLVPHPDNPRTSRTAEDIERLAVSIEANGLLVPLVVTATDSPSKYAVLDGETRRLALEKLATTDHWTGPVECRHVEGDIATAYALNEHRSQMSERDRFVAVRRMAQENRLSTAGIADRLCLPERTVMQFLALGTLPARIVDHYAGGHITIDTLRAFTFGDAARAEAVFDDILKRCAYFDAWDIRARMREDRIEIDHGFVRLLGGPEVVDAEHGGIVKDLFGERGYCVDSARVRKAAEARLAEEVEAARIAGWADAVVTEGGAHFHEPGVIPVYPEENPEAEAALEAFLMERGEDYDPDEASEEEQAEYLRLIDATNEREWTEDQRAVSRLRITVNRYGEVSRTAIVHPDRLDEAIERGVIEPERVGKAERSAADKEAVKEAVKEAGWNQAAMSRLTEISRRAAAFEVAEKPELALTLLAHALRTHYWFGLDVSFRDGGVMGADKLGGIAGKPGVDHAGTFTLADTMALSKRQRNALLAEGIAHTIRHDPALVAAVGADVRKHWTPDDEWLNTLKRDQLAEVFGDLGLGQAFGALDKRKKGELVSILDDIFAGEPIDGVPAETMKKALAAAKTWLPEPLRQPEEAEDGEETPDAA